MVTRRQLVARGNCDGSLAPAIKERIGTDHQRSNGASDRLLERPIEICIGACLENYQLQLGAAGAFLEIGNFHVLLQRPGADARLRPRPLRSDEGVPA